MSKETDMSEKGYRLVFKGEILAGQNIEEVKKNLAVMLRLDERQAADLFSRERTVIRKRADAETARRFKSAFQDAGAILTVEPLSSGEPSPAQGKVQQPGAGNASETPLAMTPGPSSLYGQVGSKGQKSIDLPAVIVLIVALTVFVALGGYIVWLGIRPGPAEEPLVKSTSRSPQVSVRRRISQKSTATGRYGKKLSQDDLFLLRRLQEEGLIHARKGDYKKAEPLYRKRLLIMAEKGGRAYPSVPAAMNDLAYVLRGQKRYKEAEAFYLESIKICKDRGKGDDLSVAVASEGLAKIYLKQGKLHKIDSLYQVAVNIWDRMRGPDNGNSLAIKQSRAELLEKLGRKDEAERLRKYVLEVRKRLWKARRSKGFASPPVPKTLKVARSGDTSMDRPKALEGAERISVSISRDFVPVRMTIAAMSGYHPRLMNRPPKDIVREPKYRGKRQKYGKLILGTQDNKTYYFVLDLLDGPHPVLYFDRNRNRDLSDDGPPLKNKGTGIFATTISIPIRQLIKELDRAEDFKIWFFTNNSLWPKGITRHYSRTQMKGRVILKGRPYLAFIAERKANDADFTNDGIYVDLNRNGKIDSKNEYVGNRKVASIDGKAYWFHVHW